MPLFLGFKTWDIIQKCVLILIVFRIKWNIKYWVQFSSIFQSFMEYETNLVQTED